MSSCLSVASGRTNWRATSGTKGLSKRSGRRPAFSGYDVEAHAERDTDLGWVERHEADRLGESVGGGEVNRVGESDGLRPRQAGGAIETPLVERHDVEVIPREADRVLQVGA